MLLPRWGSLAGHHEPSQLAAQRSAGAFADSRAFGLCDGRHNVIGQPVGFRHIGGKEACTAVLEAGEERHVGRKPVQLGDDKDWPGQHASSCERNEGDAAWNHSLAS